MYFRPDQIAERYPRIALGKAQNPPGVVFAKSVLAGIFIALTVFGVLSVGTLMETAGSAKLVGALVFPCGLAMVILAGGEAFIGNNLLVMAVSRKRLSVGDVLKNWGLVYLGNFVGSLFIAALVAFIKQADTTFIQFAVTTAETKGGYTIYNAFVRGVLCNIFVCAGIWMSYSSDSATGKIAAVFFPIMMFIICSTENSITNMMFFPVALWLGGSPSLSWPGFLLGNLLPVSLGNTVGGALVVGGLLMLSFGKELRAGKEEGA